MEPLSSIDSQYGHFAIPGMVQVIPGEGGLPKIHIATPQAEAEIYLHGAHVASWRPVGAEEVIFLSRHSRWEEGKAIRGGIPICFPWFRAKSDNAKAPAHGFVRTKTWNLESITEDQGTVHVTLSTESDDATRQLWPHDFRLLHRISVGPVLRLELVVINTGHTAIRFEEALHTYHRIAQISDIRIRGLDGALFLDNTDSNREVVQRGDIALSRLTDNAYLNTESTVELIDPVLRRSIHLKKENSASTVVWNPWDAGAKALADMGNEEWRQMVCVEASNILQCAVSLEAGKQHVMSATLEVKPLAEA